MVYHRIYKKCRFALGGKGLITTDTNAPYLSSSLSGTDVLVLTSTDVDKSGTSYYGEQTLQYISTSGESSMVQLGKE